MRSVNDAANITSDHVCGLASGLVCLMGNENHTFKNDNKTDTNNVH